MKRCLFEHPISHATRVWILRLKYARYSNLYALSNICNLLTIRVTLLRTFITARWRQGQISDLYWLLHFVGNYKCTTVLYIYIYYIKQIKGKELWQKVWEFDKIVRWNNFAWNNLINTLFCIFRGVKLFWVARQPK